ncbi:hypothetical protein HRG_012783 [Hirsutella rhossiliensis]
MNPHDRIPKADPAAADSAEQLYSSINNAYPGALVDFEAKWQAWQKTWFPANSPSSSRSYPSSYKLASRSDNFRGVDLYNELEKNKGYLVDPSDPLNYNVLQRQANLIVDINYERNKLVQARIEALKAHCKRSHVHSNSSMDTECEDYDGLRELGGSIISHLMLASKEPSGFWFELLHEMVHGFDSKTGLRIINFKEQYAAWNEWFQKGEHGQAPRWSNGIRAIAGWPRLFQAPVSALDGQR